MLEGILEGLGKGLKEHQYDQALKDRVLTVAWKLYPRDPWGSEATISSITCERSQLYNRLKDFYYMVVERLLPEDYQKER